MVAEGEVVVDLVPVAEDLHAREDLLPVQELTGEPVGDDRDGVGDALGVPGLEVDVGDRPEGPQHPPAGRQDQVDGAVGAAPGLDQAEAEAKPPLVEVALEAVEGPDLPQRAGVLEALHEPGELGRELGGSALPLELDHHAGSEVAIQAGEDRALLGVGGEDRAKVQDDAVHPREQALDLLARERRDVEDVGEGLRVGQVVGAKAAHHAAAPRRRLGDGRPAAVGDEQPRLGGAAGSLE